MDIGNKIKLILVDGTLVIGTIYKIKDNYIILNNTNINKDLVIVYQDKVKKIITHL